MKLRRLCDNWRHILEAHMASAAAGAASKTPVVKATKVSQSLLNFIAKPPQKIRYAYYQGKPWRLATPKFTKIVKKKTVKEYEKEGNEHLMKWVDDRERRIFEDNYRKKKEELQNTIRERAAREEQQFRKSMRKQSFWGAVMTEFRKNRDEHIGQEIERRRSIEDMEAKARTEWLQALHENCKLWKKDPSDLQWRKYQMVDPQFMLRFPNNHTYNLLDKKKFLQEYVEANYEEDNPILDGVRLDDDYGYSEEADIEGMGEESKSVDLKQ